MHMVSPLTHRVSVPVSCAASVLLPYLSLSQDSLHRCWYTRAGELGVLMPVCEMNQETLHI